MRIRLLLLGIAIALPASAAEVVVDMPINPETGNPHLKPVVLLDSPKYVWVASEDYRPLRSPKAGAEPSGADGLKYMEMCGCAFRWQDRSEYLLLTKGTEGEKDFRLLGWVDINMCVLKYSAQLTADEISRKAMIVNTAQSAAEAAQLKKAGKAFFEVPILLAPSPSAKPAVKDTFRLFNIYFVYGDSYPADDTVGYLLLGKSHEFNAFAAQTNPQVPRDVVLGWVPKSRICRWDTTEAVEFNADPERRYPAEIYKNVEDAQQAIDEREAVRRGAKPTVQPLFQELFPKGTPMPRPFDEMRFPLIPIREKADQRIDASGGKLQLVGFVGDYVDASGKKLLSREEVDRRRKLIASLNDQLRVTELLLVVDFTASMEPEVLKTADSIEAIVKSVRKEVEGGDAKNIVKVGLVLYSDLDSVKRPKLDDTARVFPLTAIDRDKPLADQAVGKWVEELRTKAKGRLLDEGGDNREQMFHALKLGIKSAGFSDYARKVVVLIGDYGSKRQGDNDEEIVADLLTSLTTEPDTKKKIAERAPIDFFAFQVKSPAGDPANEDLAAFPTQVKKIMDLYDASLDGVGLKDPNRRDYKVIVDPQELGSQILKRYQVLRDQVAANLAETDKIQRGQFGELKIGPELMKILQIEARKIGVTDMEEFLRSSGMQIFQFGYVWEMSSSMPKIRQTRLKYLLSEGHVRPILRALEPLVTSSDYELLGKEEKADTFVRLMVNAVIGENPSKPYGARLKAKGLRAQSALLERALKPEDIKFDLLTRQELEDIRLRAMRLEDLTENHSKDYRKKEHRTSADEKLYKYEAYGVPTPTPRKFRLYGNEKDAFYWVDFEREWP